MIRGTTLFSRRMSARRALFGPISPGQAASLLDRSHAKKRSSFAGAAVQVAARE